MKRLLWFWSACFFLLLVSCSSNVDLPAGGHDISPEGSRLSETAPAGAGHVKLDTLDIGSIMFRDLSEEQSAQYAMTNFINEFKSFISNQAYHITEDTWEEEYHVLLLNAENQTLLELSMSGRSVVFDRDVEINGSLYKKGTTYETGLWLNESMNQFLQGKVLNPVHMDYPAKVRIPREHYEAVDMLNAGSDNINQYETLDALYTFMNDTVAGRDFEIAGCERLYTDEAMQWEEAKAAQTRVLQINCSSTHLNITSGNTYDELVTGYSFSLYKDAEKPGLYRLATGGEVLLVKVDDAFDRAFQELFDNDLKSGYKLDAAEVEKLFQQKKPYSMEYLCRNLGVEQWNERPEDTLKRSSVKLDNGNAYTMLSFKSPFDLRLLFFDKASGAFIDSISFGGRAAGTEYTVQRSGKNAWIVGDRCRGYGTGIAIYNREWYTLDEQGKKLALSMPFYNVDIGPYGGSIFQANRLQLKGGDTVRLKVSYEITRIYLLDIPEANEYGQVEVTSNKQVEFVWDGSQRKFTSEFPVDDQGITQVSHTCAGISEQCGAILEKEYDRLLSGIEALASMENGSERAYRANVYELFLSDCPDGTKKAALRELLAEKAGR